MERVFDRIAKLLARPVVCMAFILALIPWVVAGIFCGWSSTFLLVLGLYLSVPPYCVMFILLYTTARDTLAAQKQNAELLRAIPTARNEYIGIESLTVDEIAALKVLDEKL